MTPLEIYDALNERGTHPVITLFGAPAGAARMELSGKVVANHCAKAANFLCDDLMLDEGDGIEIDLPPHWKHLTWTFAAHLAGLIGGSDTVVTNQDRDAETLVKVNLDALAFSTPDVPEGGYDGTADVLSQPDILLDRSRALRMDIEPAENLFLVDPVPSQLLTGIAGALASGGTLVVTDTESEERCRAEVCP